MSFSIESSPFNVVVSQDEGLRSEYQAMVDNGVTVYVVDGTNGSNANPGTESQPWKEVEWAIAYAVGPCIILIRGGTYVITRRYEDHVGISDSYSRPILSPVSQGLSETELFVVANYPGESVTLVKGSYVDDAGKKASSGVIGSSNRNWVWWDGMTVDLDNGNGRGGTFEDTAKYCRFRHVTFQNATLAGGSSNYGLVYSGRGESKYLNVMENCLLRDCRTSTNNINDGMVLLYDQSGFIARYNMLDSSYSNVNLWREKEMAKTNKVPGEAANHYYRNIFMGGTANEGFSSGRFPLSPGSADPDEYAKYLIEENIFDGVHFGGSSDESTKSRGMEGWIIRHNLYKECEVYSCDGNNNGGLELTSGFEIYNNIAIKEGGGAMYQMRPGSSSSGGAFYSRNWNKSGQPNFNAFITPSFNVDSRYAIETLSLAQWQAYGYDVDSQFLTSVSAAKFVDYDGGDYNLESDSPLKNTGRVGGEDSGAPIDPGPMANEDWTDLVGPTPM